jgi:hypothetical protein
MAQPQAQRRFPAPEKREIAFVVRAPDPNNRGRWVTLGFAWPRKNNEPGFTIKLNAVPVGAWNGALILLPPLGEEDAGDPPSE